MAVIESWIKGEMKRAVQVQYLQGNLFSADNDGNLVGVEMYDGGEPASLAGSVSANVIRADGTTVAVTGTLSGNLASVVLPQAAYAVPGVISIIIKLTDSKTGAVTTLGAVVSSVYRSTTDTVVDPGDIIPSVQTLIAAIETAVGSIPADYSSLWTSLAPAYSTSATYAVGAYVTYNGGLYRCITAITAAESWTAAHWTAAKIGTDLANLKSATKAYSTKELFTVQRYSKSATPTNGQYALEMGYWRGDVGSTVEAVTGAGTTKTCLIRQASPLDYSARFSLNDSTVYRFRLRIINTSTSVVLYESDYQSNDCYVYLKDYPVDISFCIHFGKINNTALSASDLTAISAAFGVYYNVNEYARVHLENISTKTLFTNKRDYALSESGAYDFVSGAWKGAVGATLTYDSTVTTSSRVEFSFNIASSARLSINNSAVYLMRIRVVNSSSKAILQLSDRQSNDYYVYLSDYDTDVAIAVDVTRRDGATITSTDLETISGIFGVYYSDIEQLSAVMQTKRTIVVPMELGELSRPSYLLYDQSTQYQYFYYTMRTPLFLDLRLCTSYKITTDYNITAVYYDKTYAYISTAEVVSGEDITIPSDVCFARFLATKSDNTEFTYSRDNLVIVCDGDPHIVKAIDNNNDSRNMMMCYVVPGQIGRDYSGSTAQIRTLVDTTGLIRLPPNYTNNGEPVRLIVYVHGSTDYESKWQNAIRGQVGNDEVITYLVNEGYAVFDCYGHSSDAQITDDTGHTYGSVDCSNCYIAGIRRVLDVYNIRNDGIYVTGISSGGLTALNLAFNNTLPVLACAPLAPAISLYNRCFGYTEEQRKEYAWAMGFVGDTTVLAGRNGESPSTGSVPAFTDALFTYFTNNASRTIGYNPMWNGVVGVPLSTLLSWALDQSSSTRLGGGDRNSSNWTNVCRICKTPIKIWVAGDDHNVPPSIIYNFLTTLKNGNCIGELRSVPDGQGGHYAFTSSNTTERMSGVTAIGIAYTDIPIYWVEMVTFFRSF